VRSAIPQPHKGIPRLASEVSAQTRAAAYSFGFQGQEQDDEMHGSTGTSINYKYRMHDARIGRFLSIDPLAEKYPHNSPYAFSENRVIDGIELEGLEVVLSSQIQKNFSCMIDAVNSNSVYQSIYARYLAQHDRLSVTSQPLPASTFGTTDVTRGTSAWSMAFNAGKFVNGVFAGDETFLFNVILHEGIHARKNLRIDQDGRPNYPGYEDAYTNPAFTGVLAASDLHHNQMGAFNRGELISGMQEFDKAQGNVHSSEWYDAMSWVGLTRTTAWKNLDSEQRTGLRAIIDNELNYMDYRKAQLQYDAAGSDRSRRYYSRQMSKASEKVDWDLFESTRSETPSE
jgi:RHS repeat-associated protein